VSIRLPRAVPIACLLLGASSAYAQEQPPQAQLLEEERRRVLDETIDISQEYEYDYGGWLRGEFILFDDDPYEDRRTLRFYDLRLWGSVRVAEIHRVYARILMQYTDFNSGDQYGHSQNTFDGPNLDQGFYEIDLSEALGLTKLLGRAGRQYFHLGRGIALNGTMDGLSIEGETDGWGFRALGAHTIISMDDIDSSRPDKDDSHRLFVGLSGEGPDLGAHTRPYAYALVQRDLNGTDPPGAGSIDFGYDSEYWGIGVRSQPLTFLSLRGEFIFETGRSYPDPFTVAGGSTDTESVRAHCLDLLAEAHPDLPLGLRFSAEYLWGSGDADRLSVTNTLFGNEAGTTDEGFLAFGYVHTGIALYPRPSNLHILRLGAAGRPLQGVGRLLEALDVALDWFYYRKDEEDGAISDTRADLPESYVGMELDVSVTWRPLSDVIAAVRGGVFMPGDAYSDATDDNRGFLSASLTYMF
jgi:hypothetical protein